MLSVDTWQLITQRLIKINIEEYSYRSFQFIGQATDAANKTMLNT